MDAGKLALVTCVLVCPCEFLTEIVNVFEPDDNGKFGLAMIFDSDVDFAVLEKAIQTKVKEVYPKGAPKSLMLPILDGNDSQGGREELKDKFYINGKSGKYRPGLVDVNKADIVDESEFYPGCWARATITLYHWTYMGKQGISVNVRNIQKLRDDEPLISRPSAGNEFDAVGEPETADL